MEPARAEDGAAPARAICRQQRRIVSSAKALVHTRVFFYGSNKIRAVKLQAGCRQHVHLMLRQT